MSIVDKQTFANEMRKNLSDKLTLQDINTVISELTYQLSYYNHFSPQCQENSVFPHHLRASGKS